MSNIEITNTDLTSIIVFNPLFESNLVHGSVQYPNGLLLARLTSDGHLAAYVDGGADGSGVPLAVKTQDITIALTALSPIQALIGGQVRSNKLLVWDGGVPRAIHQVEIDALRSYGIFALDSVQISEFDNQ